MKRLLLIILLLAAAVFTAYAENPKQETLSPEIQTVIDQLKLIKTYEADLEQVTAYVGFGEDEFKGRMMLKTGELAVWTYTEPNRQFYKITPEMIDYYDSEMEQLTRISLENDRQADVLKQLMLDISSITNNFDIEKKGDVLKLTPKTPMETKGIEITVQNGIFTRLVSVDSSENVTDIKFSNIVVNQPIDESKFDTTTPEGTEIIEQ